MQQINSEVIRMTGIDVRVKLAKFFTAARVDNILQLVMNCKPDQQLLDVVDAAGKTTNYDMQSMLELFTVLSLINYKLCHKFSTIVHTKFHWCRGLGLLGEKF